MLVDLIKAMDRGYDAKEPQMWPVYGTGEQLDRSGVITASEIGYCARMVKFNKLAMKEGDYRPEFGTKNHSSHDWGFFERGHTMEAWAVDMIHSGWPIESRMQLLHTGGDQVSFLSGHQSGTPDGVFIEAVGSEVRVGILEIKSIDPRTNVSRNIPKLVHIDQVMQNLDLVAERFEAVPIGGEIIYINASDYKKRYQFHIPWDERHAVRLEERAEWIMKAASPADLPAEGLFKDDCKYCAHTAQCSAIITKERNEKGSINDLEAAAQGLFRQP